MKRSLSFLFLLLLASAFLVMPVLAADLSGGYYITGDSALGSSKTFYVPADYAVGSLTYDSSGNLFNLTSSSIYLYSPDYPDYTIYAPRFSAFQYRTDSNYGSSYVSLNLNNITDTNVEIFEKDPSPLHSADKVSIMILAVLLVGVGAFVLLRR